MKRWMCVVKIFCFLAGLSLSASLVGTVLAFLLGYLVHILGLPVICFPLLTIGLVLGVLVVVSIHLGRKQCCRAV